MTVTAAERDLVVEHAREQVERLSAAADSARFPYERQAAVADLAFAERHLERVTRRPRSITGTDVHKASPPPIVIERYDRSRDLPVIEAVTYEHYISAGAPTLGKRN